MKKIGVIPNIEKDQGLAFTREVLQWLQDKGCTPSITEQVSSRLAIPNYELYVSYIQDIYEKSDFLVILGGDGTILRVAKNSALYGTPLIGINLGTLGYLTDVEKNEAFVALEKVIGGQYKLEQRMMLEANFLTEDSKNETYIALNDVCVSRGVFSSMISVELFINDQYIDTYKGDGIIVSTPTGSTAYNLSAGGPILKPDGEMIAITPICPHMIYARPSVISADDIITIKTVGNTTADGVLILDGQSRNPMKIGDIITIRRSHYYTSIIKTNYSNFYDILRHKMVYRP